MTMNLRRSRKVSKEVDTKELMFSTPTSHTGWSPPKHEVQQFVKDDDDAFLQAFAAKTGGTPPQMRHNTAPTTGERQRHSHIVDPWLPSQDEADEINKLIAASAMAKNGSALRERRKTKSKELQELESDLPATNSSSAKVQSVGKSSSSPKQTSARRKDSSGKRSPKSEANSTSPKASLKSPNGKLDAAAVGLTIDEPTGNLSFAKSRWKNAALAVAVAKEPDEKASSQSAQAAVYRMLSQQEGSTQNLSGAAARGAKAAAVGQIKMACTAAGGRFLSEDEWKAMRFETSQLRAQNKRLDAMVSEQRKQISELQNGSKHGRGRRSSDSAGLASVSLVMSQIGSFIKTPSPAMRRSRGASESGLSKVEGA